MNPICIYEGHTELTHHFFFHCAQFIKARKTLFDNIQSTDKTLLAQNEASLIRLLLYGDTKRNSNADAFSSTQKLNRCNIILGRFSIIFKIQS